MWQIAQTSQIFPKQRRKSGENFRTSIWPKKRSTCGLCDLFFGIIGNIIKYIIVLIPKKVPRKVSFRTFLGSRVSCKVSDCRMIRNMPVELVRTHYGSIHLTYTTRQGIRWAIFLWNFEFLPPPVWTLQRRKVKKSPNFRPVKRFFARSFFISTRIVNLTGANL